MGAARRIASVFCAAFLAAAPVSCALPAAAHAAADWRGSTAIVVTGASSGQISVSAPVSLPLALRADGSVLDGSAVELRNLSSTPVAVANVSVEERNGAHVLHTEKAGSTQVADVLHMRFASGPSSWLEASDCLGGGASPPDSQHWLAEPGETLTIAVHGGFKNPSASFTSTYRDAEPVTAAVVVWTVEAV